MKEQEHINIEAMNTLALPCIAQKVICFHSIREVEDYFQGPGCSEEVLIIGGGSNLILPECLKTTVLRFLFDKVSYRQQASDVVIVEVEAGKSWDDLVAETVSQGLIGLENLSYIPGTVGAAPVQNIGAYGVELADVLETVCVYDRNKHVICELDKEQCQFAYRDSIFKREPNRYCILSLKLRLSKCKDYKLDYGELKTLHSHGNDLSVSQVRDKVIEVRKAKLPEPDVLPNVGSFFKNPIVSKLELEQLKRRFPDLVSYELDNGQAKLAAGWLIDGAGWKGRNHGEVGVHDRQALVLVNLGSATQANVLALAKEIQNSIYEKFSVHLEVEPKIISR